MHINSSTSLVTDFDTNSYLDFNERDNVRIAELELKIKKEKLEHFFLYVLKNNNLILFNQLLNEEIEFYKSINTTIALNHTITEIVSAYGRNADWAISAVNNIIDFHEPQHQFVQQQLITDLRTRLVYVAAKPDLQIRIEYHRFLNIACQLVFQHPKYLPNFEDLPFPDLQEVKEKIKLNQQLQDDLIFSNIKEQRKKL